MLVFVIGAVALSIIVLWRKQNWYVYLLGLLGWAVMSSMVTMLSVIGYAFNFICDPCPITPLLSYPLSIHVFVTAYWCPNCMGYDIQIWLGGLLCWEGVSPRLIGSVAHANWLTGAIFPWLLVVALLWVFVVFAVVWGARSTVPWFRVVWVLFGI
ncbi:MAG: hypothetical protein ACXACF_02495 [Candidatus Hermodarchaeia archaeon]